MNRFFQISKSFLSSPIFFFFCDMTSVLAQDAPRTSGLHLHSIFGVENGQRNENGSNNTTNVENNLNINGVNKTTATTSTTSMERSFDEFSAHQDSSSSGNLNRFFVQTPANNNHLNNNMNEALKIDQNRESNGHSSKQSPRSDSSMASKSNYENGNADDSNQLVLSNQQTSNNTPLSSKSPSSDWTLPKKGILLLHFCQSNTTNKNRNVLQEKKRRKFKLKITVLF